MSELQVRTDGPSHEELMRQKVQETVHEVETVVQQILEEFRRNGVPPTPPLLVF